MPRDKIREHDLAYIVSRLSEFAAEAGIARDREEYVVVRHELVSRRALQTDGVALLRSKTQRSPLLRLPFSAERVLIKANARVFGLRRLPGQTASVQLATHAGHSIFRECRARRLFEGLLPEGSPVAVPRLRAWDRRHGRWLIEERVDGKPPSDGDLNRLVREGLEILYRPTVRPRTVLRSPGRRAFARRVEEVLRAHAPSFPPIDEKDTWLVGLCHNDLNDDNMLIHRDRIWLIDWENAGVVPLTADLGRLFIKRPNLKASLLALIESACAEHGTIPALHQLALGAAFEAERLRLIRSFWVNDAIWEENLTPEQASEEHRRTTAEAFVAVASLG